MQCGPSNRVFARVFTPSGAAPFFTDLEKSLDAAWRKAFHEKGDSDAGEFDVVSAFGVSGPALVGRRRSPPLKTIRPAEAGRICKPNLGLR